MEDTRESERDLKLEFDRVDEGEDDKTVLLPRGGDCQFNSRRGVVPDNSRNL